MKHAVFYFQLTNVIFFPDQTQKVETYIDCFGFQECLCSRTVEIVSVEIVTGPDGYILKPEGGVWKFLKHLHGDLLHINFAVEMVVNQLHHIEFEIVAIKLNHHHTGNGQQKQDDQNKSCQVFKYDPQLSFHLYVRNSLKSCE